MDGRVSASVWTARAPEFGSGARSFMLAAASAMVTASVTFKQGDQSGLLRAEQASLAFRPMQVSGKHRRPAGPPSASAPQALSRARDLSWQSGPTASLTLCMMGWVLLTRE